MDRPRISTVVSAALASAAAFYVITRSGLAGTLAGAAVASVVYTATSHGVHTAAERLQSGRGRAAVRAEEDKRPAPEPVEPSISPTPARPIRSRPIGRPLTRMVSTWGPVLLAGAALVAAVYSLNTGAPLERVVVHELVVEKPVVTERVVVQTKTVTVTQPAQDGVGNVAPGGTSTSTTVGSTAPAPISTTTTAPATTSTTGTTGTVPPASTTSPTTPVP